MALCGHVHADSALRDIRWKDANAGTAEEVEVRLRIRTDAKGKITVNKQQKRLR
jgi:hypothetical protein